MLKNTPLMGGAAIVATAGLAASAHGAPNALDGLLAHAEVVGPAGQPELIIPMETPGWAQALGVTATSRYYKGLCGPDGAAATIEQLIAHAERDLNGWQNRGALTTQSVGTSPQFDISFNALNALLVYELAARDQYFIHSRMLASSSGHSTHVRLGATTSKANS